VGIGGGLEPPETPEEAMRREMLEEIAVTPLTLKPMGFIAFRFVAQPTWNMDVYLFNCHSWQGEPNESDEVAPKWFKCDDIPYYSEMWEDSRYWLPWLLLDKPFKAQIVYGEHLAVSSLKMTVV